MEERIELIWVKSGDRDALASPGVGFFCGARPLRAMLGPGATAGRLITLGRSRELVVPDGVRGSVIHAPHELVRRPVGYKTVLYELAPIGGEPHELAATNVRERSDAALVVRAGSSGRYWHRASPNDPPLVAEGLSIADGSPVGLIEVMKTFAQVIYRAHGALPARATIARVLVADGAEVSEGDALFEIAAG